MSTFVARFLRMLRAKSYEIGRYIRVIQKNKKVTLFLKHSVER